MHYEETTFESERPDGKDREGNYKRRKVSLTWYRATDGRQATGWTPLKLKRDERTGNSRPSAEKLWERGSVFDLPPVEAAFAARQLPPQEARRDRGRPERRREGQRLREVRVTTAFNASNHVWNRPDRIVFEYHSNFDKDGRRRFTLWWWQNDYHLGPMIRSQEFNANPTPYLERHKGKEITEVATYE